MKPDSDLLTENDFKNLIDAVEMWRNHVCVEPGTKEMILLSLIGGGDRDTLAKKLEIEREKYQAQARLRQEDATMLLAKLITFKRALLDRGGKAMTIEEIAE